MKTLKDLMPTRQNQVSNPKASGLPTSIEKTLNARSKQQLAELLSQICALQKVYGKTQDELEVLVEGFAWALAEYDMQQIVSAMRKYIIAHSDVPAPADIVKLIQKEISDGYIDNLMISSKTLREWQAKGIPLSPAQKSRLGKEDDGFPPIE